MDALIKAFTDSAAPLLAPLLASIATAAAPAAVAAPLPVAVAPVAAPVAGALGGVGLSILLEPTGGWVFRGACNTAGIIYPVYKSFKAIESKNQADDTQWLTYWTIYGSVLMLEHLGDELLRKMPYYYHLKFGLLLWLQLPQTQGAYLMYTKYYKPTLTKYQGKIDAVIAKGQELMMYLYQANRVPITLALSVLVAARVQGEKAVRWFLEQGPGSGSGLGPADAAAKPAAA